MSDKPKVGVFIGRLQPVHNAHLAVIRLALSEMDKLVIILGSDCQAKTVKNPWTSAERMAMLNRCLTPEERERVAVVPAKDYLYNNNLWLSALQSSLSRVYFISRARGQAEVVYKEDNTRDEWIDLDDCDVTLYGHDKDRSTFYLHLFPQWTLKETGEIGGNISATQVRGMFFHKDSLDIRRHVPEPVFEQLHGEIGTEEYERLYQEYRHISEYKQMWSNTPYPVSFITTDAVVIKSGHVLVVKRRGYPGKGLLALPGGFLNPKEQVINGCIRELKEETCIQIPKDELQKRIIDEKVFDHPERSLRGRTITHAFCIDLGSGTLPKVKGDDDAEHAFWMPIRDVLRNEEQFFEDHFHIINYFCVRR